MAQSLDQGRLDWVDVAKGICIILVVMMHSTLGVEKAIGTETRLHAFIEWARPFRMPDFFLISGLFLAARIDRPWRAYLDTKVVHFAYFYVLWVNIQFAMKAPGMVQEAGINGVAAQYLLSYVQPFGTLWFIYLLAVFFVATKLLRDVPKPVVLVGAALLHVLAPHTGWLVIDEFADRFVFFYTGYAAAPLVLALAARIWTYPSLLLIPGAGVVGMAQLAGGRLRPRGHRLVRPAVRLRRRAGRDRLQRAARPQRMGRRARLLRPQLDRHLPRLRGVHGSDPRTAAEACASGLADATALAVTAAGVLGALSLFWLVRNTPARFLFVRPDAFKLVGAPAKRSWPAAAPQPSVGA